MTTGVFCLVLGVKPKGKSIQNQLKAWLPGDHLHPLQRQVLRARLLYQCGICTPGVLVAFKALLRPKPRPDRRKRFVIG